MLKAEAKSWMGASKYAALLTATLKTARHSPAIKPLQDRLHPAGKLPKMACMRKRLTSLNAAIKTNQRRDKSPRGAELESR
jgi:hypothetical protein